jgi:hypothetical protein
VERQGERGRVRDAGRGGSVKDAGPSWRREAGGMLGARCRGLAWDWVDRWLCKGSAQASREGEHSVLQ